MFPRTADSKSAFSNSVGMLSYDCLNIFCHLVMVTAHRGCRGAT